MCKYKAEKLCHGPAGDLSGWVTVLQADTDVVAEVVQEEEEIGNGYRLKSLLKFSFKKSFLGLPLNQCGIMTYVARYLDG